ncbi:MAG: amidohydrolase family protein, partial [Chloroflexi bacterium]|nr:amidohydrolase family protein [Chloroflexota bacterium]
MIELERPRGAEGSGIRATGELLIKGGRLIDPSRGIDEVGDLLVADGRVVGFSGERRLTTKSGRSLDATGYIVCPGFVDLHAHLREPGGEDAETFATGLAAAAHGGYGSVCSFADTRPPLDRPE